MVQTRRSSRLQSTPQRRRDTDIPDGATTPAVAATPKMPALDEANEGTEAASSKQAATPHTSDPAPAVVSAEVKCTPTSKAPIAPSGIDMHPHHHKHSTAKPMDEARWLGFLNMGARTEPVKKGSSKIPVTQATPTKSQEITNTFSTPEFKFRFRRPSLELSPEGKKLMEESRQEAEKIRAQMAANPEQYGIEPTEDMARRIATPKGKTSRYSAAHMSEFKKMDSIANHPSVLRADRNRLKPAAAALKRSPSKAELDKSDKPNGKLPRTNSTATLNKAADDGAPGPSKRVKHVKENDVSATRHGLTHDESKQEGLEKNTTVGRSNIGIPRSIANLTTPTKASLARSQSVKTLKKTTFIPTLARSPSGQALRTPSKTPATFMDGLRKASQTVSRLPSMKSILRSPVRHYSNDPAKIAAGTHVTSPPDLSKNLPDVPATEPSQKHVIFSESTHSKPGKGNAEAAHASTEAPQAGPSDGTHPKMPALSPARRAAMGTGDFTFRSDRTIKFGGSAKKPTIRHVRSSDAAAALPDPFNNASAARKRKVDVPSEITESEKENGEEDGRAAKRVKSSVKPTAKKPETGSKTPQRKDTRRGVLSTARLNHLAQPKRRV